MGFTLGGVLGAVSGVIQGVSAFTASRRNADAADDVAEREARKTKLEIDRTRRTARRIAGTQQTIFAKRGVRGDAGSALDIIADDMAETELDVQLLEEGGSIAENLAASEARESRRRGTEFLAQGLLVAGASLAGDR